MIAITALYRRHGIWTDTEAHRLTETFGTAISKDSNNPEYLLMQGRYAEDNIRETLKGSKTFAVFLPDDERALPFVPEFLQPSVH